MGWKEKTPRKLSFGVDVKEGQTLEGTIESCQPAGSLEVNTYTMSTTATADKPGELISFLGNTMLDKVLPGELGNLVRIKYLGKVQTSSHFQVMQFKVDVWNDNEESEANTKEADITDKKSSTSKKK